jgi:hypothetical protein
MVRATTGAHDLQRPFILFFTTVVHQSMAAFAARAILCGVLLGFVTSVHMGIFREYVHPPAFQSLLAPQQAMHRQSHKRNI